MTTFSSAEQMFKSSNPEIAPYAAVISPTGLPAPVLGDDPNVPRDMLALTAALDDSIVPTFATTAARDAARTAGATFTLCYVLDVVYRWRSTVWVPLIDQTDLTAALVPTLPKMVLIGAPVMTPGNLAAAGGNNGIAAPVTVPTATYDRIIRASLDVTLTTATTFCVIHIWKNGVVTTQVRIVTPQNSAHVEFVERIAAGTAAYTLQPILNSTAAATTYGAPYGAFYVTSTPA